MKTLNAQEPCRRVCMFCRGEEEGRGEWRDRVGLKQTDCVEICSKGMRGIYLCFVVAEGLHEAASMRGANINTHDHPPPPLFADAQQFPFRPQH